MRTKISIAMATYNGETHLLEQLESLAKQTVLPYELVVCDDCSKDRTLEILRDFAVVAPFPVRIIVNEANLGFSDNFLKAAAFCSGDWIAFCDQDDIWLPAKIAGVCEVIESYASEELVLVGHSAFVASADLQLTGQRAPDFKRNSYIKRASTYAFSGIHGFAMVFRASLLKEVDQALRPRNDWDKLREPPPHDYWISMLANAVGDMATISEPLAIWRRHDCAATWSSNCWEPRQTIADDAKAAAVKINPDPYVSRGLIAKETAESFEKLAERCANEILKDRLLVGAGKFSRLAENFFRRAELYTHDEPLSKFKAFARMLLTNAYFGSKFYALGWRSLAKDAAFAVGLIGRSKG